MRENPQFLRTDKAIRQALITLLKSKPFEKITVQDILDETPVTRSTFYKHYHDKYEILEKMQDDFLSTQELLRKELHANPTNAYYSLQKTMQDNREIMNTLLSVRTEHVDLRKMLAQYSYEYYMANSKHNNRQIEAQIFSQMITEFQLSQHPETNASFEYLHDTLISVMFMAFGIPQDDELRELIKAKAMPTANTPK